LEAINVTLVTKRVITYRNRVAHNNIYCMSYSQASTKREDGGLQGGRVESNHRNSFFLKIIGKKKKK
jgi:hypothetical protein